MNYVQKRNIRTRIMFTVPVKQVRSWQLLHHIDFNYYRHSLVFETIDIMIKMGHIRVR
jgi:hypothetical protein